MTTPPDGSRRCAVCGLNVDDYPLHERLHDPATVFDVARVADVERINITLRIELGLRPGSGGAGTWAPTVPPNLPGIGVHRDDDEAQS